MVGPGISSHQRSRLPDCCLAPVSKHSRGEAAGKRRGSGGSCKLQHGSLARIPGGYDTSISPVFSGHNGTSCWQKLLPGSLQLYDVDANTPFVDVLLCLESGLVPPEWVPSARHVRTRSSFICKTSRMLDFVEVSL